MTDSGSQPALAPVQPDLFWFHGPDAIRFLNDLVSQEIGEAPPGAVRRSLLLTPQGKLHFMMWLLRDEDRVGLAVDDGLGEELVETLRRFLIRVKVEIDRVESPMRVVVGMDGPSPGRWSENDEGLVADVSWVNLRRALVVGEEPSLPVLDEDSYTALRIRAGEPEIGVDVDETTIPQETGVVPSTVSFTKGCFLGQELVARLDSRGGRVNRVLRILEFEGGTPPRGAEVLEDGGAVGVLTSVAKGLGMARLHRDVAPGATVEAGGLQATVRGLPANPET
jgi:tRNA-modifying protein YgfZ